MGQHNPRLSSVVDCSAVLTTLISHAVPSQDMPESPGGETPPNMNAADGWQNVITEMEATAETYRDRGWTAVELHPGDSILVDSAERLGLDVVLPGDEYETIETTVAAYEFSDVEVFRAVRKGMVYLLIAERAPGAQAVIFVPAYYALQGTETARETIRDKDELTLFCRRLTDTYVLFNHTEVDPFLPATDADD